MLEITPLYAGLIALLFIALSARVIKGRISGSVSVGDGGNKALSKRIRVQGNCAEYAPFGLLLLAMAEIQGIPGWLVHVFGAMLFFGRVLHAYGFGATPQVMAARQAGMVLTLTMIATVAIANVLLAVF